MKQVGYVHIEVDKEESKYSFVMPMGASLADASAVSFQIFKTIDKMYRDALDKEIAEQEEKEPSES